MKFLAKKRFLCGILILALCSLYTIDAKAQNSPASGSVGISSSVQGSSTTFFLPIWVSDDLVLAPAFGLFHQEDNRTTITVGLAPRFYQVIGDNFGSYLGGRGLLLQNSPDNANDTTDFILGATGGGEYYLNSHFSLGVELQLNYNINDVQNNVLRTGSAVTASYYF